MSSTKSKILLFGGTFDPIHDAHILICERARKQIKADRVILIPSKNPRWKAPTEDINHRLNMINLQLKANNLNYEIEDYEINSNSEVNYSIDTVKYLIKKIPNAKFYFLIGSDQVEAFNRWKNAEELSKLVQVVYYGRSSIQSEQFCKNIKDFNLKHIKGREIDLSSTSIRELKSLNTSFSVINYIVDNDLYFMPKVKELVYGKRLEHSISVAKVAYNIALKNNLKNPGDYYIAGLIHDCGKLCPDERKLEIMKKHYKKYVSLPKVTYHQFVGDYLAKHELNITDKRILNAIKYHCSGRAKMGVVEKVIYASDKIEPTRGYDSSDYINRMEENYEDGFVYILGENLKFVMQKHNMTPQDFKSNSLTYDCIKYYLEEKELTK
ncbi:MAG: nicotinate (nicotinamide) nucleotide adenylyltransferase [Bacilli bacterium]|nr:nicotinate (nicotinamide) nucleotide adenylyltransferase [Bacilli bacterium]